MGEALYYPPTDEPCKEFPSPESLKGRIIISTKPPKEYLEAPPAGNKATVKALAKEDKQDAKTSSPLKEDALSEKVEKFHIDQVIIPSQSCNLCTEIAMVMDTFMSTCFSVSFHTGHMLDAHERKHWSEWSLGALLNHHCVHPAKFEWKRSKEKVPSFVDEAMAFDSVLL